MTDIFSLSSKQMASFILIMTRSSGIFFLSPVLGSRNVPAWIKIGLSFFLAIVAYPFIKLPAELDLSNAISFALIAGKELAVGLLIGYITFMFFSAILIAGQLIDMQMGFGLVNIIDPMSRVQVPVMGQLKYLVAILIFLTVNGHHWLIMALSKSFDLVPMGSFSFSTKVTTAVFAAFTDVFILAFKISAPILMTLIIVDIALGIVARTMPQMNVFIVGFPIKITVGFITYILALPFMATMIMKLFETMQNNIYVLIKAGGG